MTLSDHEVATALDTDKVVLDAASFAVGYQDSPEKPKNIHLGLRISHLKVDFVAMSHFRHQIRLTIPLSCFVKNESFDATIRVIESGFINNPTLQEISDDIRAAIQEAFGTV